MLNLGRAVRTVLPQPPHDPEAPEPDIALGNGYDARLVPVYSYNPLPSYSAGFAGGGPSAEARPDLVVFGEPYWPKAVVGWHDHEGTRTACWACGRTGTVVW